MKSLITIVIVLATAVASAEPVVLAVTGKDIYVELGAKDGVGAGSELELLHEVVARDPRGGGQLRDRFALGTITVIKSGNAISVARADADLAKRVLPGDRVRLVSAPRQFVDPWAEQVAASKGMQMAPAAPVVAPAPAPTGPPIDHAALTRQAWQDTLGQPPEKRIERWRALVAADPATPYRKTIEAEITSLRIQWKEREAALDRARSTAIDDRNPRIAQLASQLETSPDDRGSPLVVGPILRAVPGRPIQLAFLARAPATVRTAWLYVRPDRAPGYTRIELLRDGDAYLRGTIDGSLVKGEKLHWYVEVATGTEGDVESALGSQTLPREIEIDGIVEEAPIEQGRTHIDGHVDYVDFDGKLGGGFDQYLQAEMDFTYRFITPIHAVRLGFGSLTGTGGPKDIIDEDTTDQCLDAAGMYQCEKLSFSYVYTEFEMRVRPNVALMIRPQAGVLITDTMADTDDGRCRGIDTNSCRFNRGFGVRGRLRLGDELGTNLIIGAGFTSGVGTLLEAAYNWLPNKVVPVQITVQVTDQPVIEDFGVRLIADVGIRRVAWFYPSVRVSYQARDIDHAGLSGGFALNFDW